MDSNRPSVKSIGRARPFRRSLVASVVIVVLLLGASLFVVAELTLTRVLEKSSSALAAQIVNRVEGELQGLFAPIGATLKLTLAAARDEVLGTPNLQQVEYFLVSLMETLPQISSAELARQNGHAFMLLKEEEGWLSRQMRPDEWGYDALWRRRSTNGEVTEWRAPFEYEVTQRPWFVGAVAQFEAGGGVAAGSAIAWTEPYTFATTGDAGITASAAIEEQDGELLVISLDVLLRDLSRFALDVTRSKPGQVFILDGPPGSEDTRLLGVPFEPSEIAGAELPILESPASVGGAIADFSTFFAGDRAPTEEPSRFSSGDATWWGVAKHTKLDPERNVWIAVLIPEIELREGLPPVHRITILATLVMLIVAVALALRLARTYSEPVDALVVRSQRMERLNFEPVAEPVRSRITELRQLAATFESLRQALAGFTNKREDLRIATAIHNSLTSTDSLTVEPLEAAGWCEHSDEVGGAVYDLLVLAGERRGIAALVLDLAGFGIETATALTRLSSVFRAAAGTGLSADRVGKQVLEAAGDLDRPASPRFWLALADAESLQVEVVARGLTWVAGGGDNTLPPTWHGTAELVDEALPATLDSITVSLEGGGYVAALTSAIAESTDCERRRWGRDGTESALATALNPSVAALRAALVTGLKTHHDGPPEDRAFLVVTAVR